MKDGILNDILALDDRIEHDGSVEYLALWSFRQKDGGRRVLLTSKAENTVLLLMEALMNDDTLYHDALAAVRAVKMMKNMKMKG